MTTMTPHMHYYTSASHALSKTRHLTRMNEAKGRVIHPGIREQLSKAVMHARRTRSIVQRGRAIYRDVAHNAGRTQPSQLQITWLRLQYCVCYRLVELIGSCIQATRGPGKAVKFEAAKAGFGGKIRSLGRCFAAHDSSGPPMCLHESHVTSSRESTHDTCIGGGGDWCSWVFAEIVMIMRKQQCRRLISSVACCNIITSVALHVSGPGEKVQTVEEL